MKYINFVMNAMLKLLITLLDVIIKHNITLTYFDTSLIMPLIVINEIFLTRAV
jgi:hypothetical protein